MTEYFENFDKIAAKYPEKFSVCRINKNGFH